MIELKNTNAWQEFPLLPEASFDLICTDPPYMDIADTSSAERSKKQGLTRNVMLGVFTPEMFKTFGLEIFRVLKPGRHAYIFTQEKVYSETRTCLLDAGFRIRGTLIWGKRNFTRGAFDWDYPTQSEMIIYCHKPRPDGKAADKLFGAVHSNLLMSDEFPNLSPMNMIHTTQKPVKLLEYLISRSSQAGERVFDPFCGVATTLIAAKNTCRNALGFELDVGYYKKGLYLLGDLN
jgi:DNA modification methylase